MAGIIGTGQELQRSAISGLTQASMLESQRDIANRNLAAQRKATEKQTQGTAAGIAAYAAPKIAGQVEKLMTPAAGSAMDSEAGTAAMQYAADAQPSGGTVLADGSIASPDAVMASAPEGGLTSTGAATDLGATAGTEAGASVATEAGTTAAIEAGTGAATDLGATAGAEAGIAAGAEAGLSGAAATTGGAAVAAETAGAVAATAGAEAAGGAAAAGAGAAAGASSIVPVVGWVAAAGLAIYSLGSMMDWW